MALLGQAAIAMWWDMPAAQRDEFEDWHSHEHFPERLSIPGFLRGSRWCDADGGEGFFVLYELDDAATLASPQYLARLNAPTPWSTKMMPHHRNMVRTQCRVIDSTGGALARFVLAVRVSPAAGQDAVLRDFLAAQGRALATQPGTTAAHLLQAQAPAIPQTLEQKIRGADQSADWAWLACGYDAQALRRLQSKAIDAAALAANGAVPDSIRFGLYTLSHTALPADAR